MLLGRARTEQTLDDMVDDLQGLKDDQARRIVRARAVRQLTMWFPKPRWVADGEVLRCMADAAFSGYACIFSGDRDRPLVFSCLSHAAMRHLAQDDFADVFVPRS